MKKSICKNKLHTALFIAFCILVLSVSAVFCDDLWKEDYYRASDVTNDLSEAQRADLDKLCIEFMKAYGADLALLATTPEKYEGMTLSELAKAYFDDCGFGYGGGHDGFQMAWDVESGEIVVCAYGSAADMIPQDYLDFTAKTAIKYQEEYGSFGPMYSSYKMLANYMEEKTGIPPISTEEKNEAGDDSATDTGEDAAITANDADTAEAETADAADVAETKASADTEKTDESEETEKSISELEEDLDETVENTEDGASEASEKNAENTKSGKSGDRAVNENGFDETLKRVVDDADLFTPEQEQIMEKRLSEIRGELSKDIVIYTANSTEGKERKIYAADFYDYGGYGFGPNHEGACLFVCMDPDDRGWWCCCTGHVTMGLYSESVANEIDDMLYPYMKSGRYYEGITDWIENFRNIYITGSPYLGDWAVQERGSFEPFHDETAPRVIDNGGLFTEEECVKLEDEAKKLADAYNIDIIIHTAQSAGPLTEDDYVYKFYHYNGYGRGDTFDGIMLTVFKRGSSSPHIHINAYGSAEEKLTEKAKGRLEWRLSWKMSDTGYYEPFSAWIDQTGHVLKTGRAPRSAASWALSIICELLAGLLFGSIVLSRAKRGMETPAVKENAGAYLVAGSLDVKKISDTYLSSSTTRKYDPIRTESSSSSSGSSSRSSYSSSYRGSSGTSHSGSGRSF